MTEALVPCTCRVVVKRDPRNLQSRTRVFVNDDCPHHGLKPTEGTKHE